MKLTSLSSYTILLAFALLVAIATWVVPTGDYQYQTNAEANLSVEEQFSNDLSAIPDTYATAEQQTRHGLTDVLKSPLWGFYEAIQLVVFVLVMGGFTHLAFTSGITNFCSIGLASCFKGRETMLIILLMTTFALFSSVFGTDEEVVAFYIMFIPVMILLGYDTVTAVATILLGVSIGQIGSLTDPNIVGLLSGLTGASLASGLLLRLVLMAVCLAMSSYYIIRYAKQIKEDPSKSIVYNKYERDYTYFIGEISPEQSAMQMTKRQKAVFAVYIFSYLLLMFATIPWQALHLPMIPSLMWNLEDLAAVFFGFSLVLGIIAGFSEQAIVQSFISGVQNMTRAAIIIGLARGITELTIIGGLPTTIIHWTESWLAGSSSAYFFAIVEYCSGLLLSLLVVSPTELAGVSMPVLAPLATLTKLDASAIVTISQATAGTVKIIAPTSVTLLAGLSLARIELRSWFKFISPLVLAISGVCLLLILLGISFG